MWQREERFIVWALCVGVECAALAGVVAFAVFRQPASMFLCFGAWAVADTVRAGLFRQLMNDLDLDDQQRRRRGL